MLCVATRRMPNSNLLACGPSLNSPSLIVLRQFPITLRRVCLYLLIFAFSLATNNSVQADLQDTLRQLVQPVDRTPHPAVARVVVSEQDAISKGSGTLIEVYGDYGVVLTNWHVVRDATGPIQVTFPNGFQSFAVVLKDSETWDLAALKIQRPPIKPMRIGSTVPRPGAEITIAGYGSGQYRAARGRCTQYCAPDPKSPFEMIEASVEARHGDSGGPMINAQGELAGVLFGASRGTTSGTHIGRVYEFVAPILIQLRGNAGGSRGQMVARATPDPYYPPKHQSAPPDFPVKMTKHRTRAKTPLANFAKYAKKIQLSNDRRDLLGHLPLPNATTENSKTLVTTPDGVSLHALTQSPSPEALADVPPALPVPNSNSIAFGTQPRNSLPTHSAALDVPYANGQQPEEYISLSEFAGRSRWEQLKSAFALVGVIFVFDQLMRTGAK